MGLAALVWVGTIASGAALCVIACAGEVQREVAKVRSEAAAESAIAIAREEMGAGAVVPFERTVKLSNEGATVRVEEGEEEGQARAVVRATGEGENGVTWTWTYEADLGKAEGRGQKAESEVVGGR